MYEALETGFNIAGGKYFYWLNSDDYLLDENSVQRLMDILNEKDFEWAICKIAISEFDAKPKVYIPLICPQWIIKNGHANNCFWGFYNKKIQYFQKIYILKLEELIKKFKMAGDYDLGKDLQNLKNWISLILNLHVIEK